MACNGKFRLISTLRVKHLSEEQAMQAAFDMYRNRASRLESLLKDKTLTEIWSSIFTTFVGPLHLAFVGEDFNDWGTEMDCRPTMAVGPHKHYDSHGLEFCAQDAHWHANIVLKAALVCFAKNHTTIKALDIRYSAPGCPSMMDEQKCTEIDLGQLKGLTLWFATCSTFPVFW